MNEGTIVKNMGQVTGVDQNQRREESAGLGENVS
jgi:hypothetical protein